MRKIIVNDETWGYMIGKHNVVIQSPRTEKKMIFTLDKVVGRSFDAIDRGRHKKTNDGMITPADLRTFILRDFPKPKEEEK